MTLLSVRKPTGQTEKTDGLLRSSNLLHCFLNSRYSHKTDRLRDTGKEGDRYRGYSDQGGNKTVGGDRWGITYRNYDLGEREKVGDMKVVGTDEYRAREGGGGRKTKRGVC